METKRPYVLGVRFFTSEKELILKGAKLARRKKSDFVREAALKIAKQLIDEDEKKKNK